MFRVPTADIYIYHNFPREGEQRGVERETVIEIARRTASGNLLGCRLTAWLRVWHNICRIVTVFVRRLSVSLSVCRSYCLLCMLCLCLLSLRLCVFSIKSCPLANKRAAGCPPMSVCVPVCTQVASATTYQQTAPPLHTSRFPCGNPQIAP